MGIFRKDKKHGQSSKRTKDHSTRESDHSAISEFIKQQNIDIHKQFPVVANLSIPEIVPGVALDEIKEAAANHDGVVQHVNGGYTVIIATNDMLQENASIGGAIKVRGKKQTVTANKGSKFKPTVFGQLAADLRKSNISSVTIPANMAAGELVLLPNEQTLYRLSDLNVFDDFKFRWGVFPEAIEDDAMSTAVEMVGPDDGVSLKELADLMRKQTPLRFDVTRKNILVGNDESMEQSKSAPNDDPFDVDVDEVADAATEEIPPSKFNADDYEIEGNDDVEFANNNGDELKMSDSESDQPASQNPVIDESKEPDSADSQAETASAGTEEDLPASDDDDEWGDIGDFLNDMGDDAPEENYTEANAEQPESQTSPATNNSSNSTDNALVSDTTSSKPDEQVETPAMVASQARNTVTKLYHDLDSGISYDENAFDMVFKQRMPLQFTLSPNPDNDMLINLANQYREDANSKLANLSEEHFAELKRHFTIRMNGLLEKAKDRVALDSKDNKFGQRYAQIEKERDEDEANRDNQLAKAKEVAETDYNQARQKYVNERIEQAQAEYDRLYRGALESKLQGFGDRYDADVATRFAKRKNELNVQRTTLATKSLAAMSDRIILDLSETYEQFKRDEQAVFDEFNTKIQKAVDSEYATDTQRQQALATSAETQRRLNEFIAENEHLKQAQAESKHAHEQELAQAKATATDAQDAAIEQQKKNYEAIINSLREKVNASEAAQKDLQQDTISKNDKQVQDHKAELAAQAERYESQLALAREESKTRHRTSITLGSIGALVVILAGIGIGFVGSNMMENNNQPQTTATQAATTPQSTAPIIIQNGSSAESSSISEKDNSKDSNSDEEASNQKNSSQSANSTQTSSASNTSSK